MFIQEVTQRKRHNYYVRCALIVLYMVGGVLLDSIGESLSIEWFHSCSGTLGTTVWLPLYPLYLLCRTQCFICYSVRIAFPYVMGLLCLLYMTRLVLLTLLQYDKLLVAPLF